jgi:hypothetical protein
MTDPLSMNPHDEELLVEIELLTELMIAANETDGRVDADTIDLILTDCPQVEKPISKPTAPHQRAGPPGPGLQARSEPPEKLLA